MPKTFERLVQMGYGNIGRLLDKFNKESSLQCRFGTHNEKKQFHAEA